MKKLLYIFILTAVVFAGCDPMEDIYDNIDENQPLVNVQKIEGTINAEQYKELSGIALAMATNKTDSAAAKSIETEMAFNSTWPADVILPKMLANQYHTIDDRSSYMATYNEEIGEPAIVAEYEGADSYYLNRDDYATVDDDSKLAEGFYPGVEASDYIPSILDNNISNPVDGDLLLVNYNYYLSTPMVDKATIFEESFNGSLGTFSGQSVSGDQVWVASSYSSDEFAKMSGYSNGSRYENEDWLVSSEIDLSEQNGNISIQIRQAINYFKPDVSTKPLTDFVKFYISTDYVDDVTTAAWTELTVNTLPEGTGWTFVDTEEIDIATYAGEKIHFAFKYISEADNSDATVTWEVDWFKVIGTGVTGDIDKRTDMYTYDGGWELDENIMVLNTSDYDAMGAPGKYNNFSSSSAPENYLPEYLAANIQYSQEGDEILVGYKYYSGGTNFYVDNYIFSNGIWIKESEIVEVTNQFLFNGIEWFFDPTVTYKMTSSDYKMIVDYVKANINESYIDKFGTGESYYGASAYHKNFDIENDGSYDKKVFAKWQEAVKAGVNVWLTLKYPDAVAQVKGVDVFYNITINTYDGEDKADYTLAFQCTGPATFTYTNGLPEK